MRPAMTETIKTLKLYFSDTGNVENKDFEVYTGKNNVSVMKIPVELPNIEFFKLNGKKNSLKISDIEEVLLELGFESLEMLALDIDITNPENKDLSEYVTYTYYENDKGVTALVLL